MLEESKEPQSFKISCLNYQIATMGGRNSGGGGERSGLEFEAMVTGYI
jgi:hypothetical protein